jgi:hypothetical protein
VTCETTQNRLLAATNFLFRWHVAPMSKSRAKPTGRKSRRYDFSLAAEDVEAARKLLALIAEQSENRPVSADRGALLERARLVLGLKQRRVELLGRDFSAEPPFDMLLALCIHEETDETVTVTRLAQLAHLTLSTTLRWLDLLVSNGWIDRGTVDGDARKSRLTLTNKSRQTLARLLR